MSQASDSEPVETIALPSLRKESGSAPAADARVSRVILRIPDCTARLSTIQGESAGWWSKLQNVSQLQSISQIAGPWLDVVRPIIPPRVLAASIIGILLGFVMILLTPSEKPIPTFRAHREQAATSQRPIAPPPAVGIEGPLPTVGVTERESAADMAFRPAAPAAVSTPQPQSENVLRPGSSGARLIPAIEQISRPRSSQD